MAADRAKAGNGVRGFAAFPEAMAQACERGIR